TPQRSESAERECSNRYTGLHVEDAWPVSSPRFDAERSRRECPRGPHGVEVADDHQLAVVTALTVGEIEARADALAKLRVGQQLDRRADLAQAVAKVFGDARRRLGVTRHR